MLIPIPIPIPIPPIPNGIGIGGIGLVTSLPLLLIFDGHYSHLPPLRAVRLAIEHGIHLLALPSHSTHILQPLDVHTLKYVKQEWKKLLRERNKTTSRKMEKSDFTQLFPKLYEYALIPAHCSTAFAKSGIFPYDPTGGKEG